MIEISNCLNMIRQGVPVPEEYNRSLRGWRFVVYRVCQWLSYITILTLAYYGLR